MVCSFVAMNAQTYRTRRTLHFRLIVCRNQDMCMCIMVWYVRAAAWSRFKSQCRPNRQVSHPAGGSHGASMAANNIHPQIVRTEASRHPCFAQATRKRIKTRPAIERKKNQENQLKTDVVVTANLASSCVFHVLQLIYCLQYTFQTYEHQILVTLSFRAEAKV